MFNIDFYSLTFFDYAVFLIIGLSMLFGFLKGFIKTFLHFLGWVLSAVLTFEFYPELCLFLKEYIENEIIIKLISSIGLFVVLLIVITVINNKIIDFTSGIRGGAVDMSLGMFLGFIRGFIICCIIFWSLIVLLKAWDDRLEPNWLKDSQSYNLLKIGSDYIMQYLLDEDIHKKVVEVLDKPVKSKIREESINEELKKELANSK